MNVCAKILLLATAVLCSQDASAVEVTALQAGAHGFPALLDSNGKKLAGGDFSQWLEEERLRIRIIYRFKSGHRIEEEAAFRQKPELIQDEWSWREIKEGKLYREFKIDFASQTATAQKRENDEMKTGPRRSRYSRVGPLPALDSRSHSRICASDSLTESGSSFRLSALIRNQK